MASISLGNQGTRKALDAAVPLIPMIDLLLCCVMFLLVTAVWNELASLPASQRLPGVGIDTPAEPRDDVTLAIRSDGYELSSLSGDRKQLADARGNELRELLASFRKLHTQSPLTIAADDGVAYAKLIHALDQARAAGFQQVDVAASDAAR